MVIHQQKVLWVKFEEHMLNEAVTQIRLKKLRYMFNVVCRGLNKDLKKVTRQDIEKFLNKINKNEFKKIDGKVFSGSTKADIKKFLKQFYKWFKGNSETYPKEVSWIKARISKDEKPEQKPVLSIAEVKKLANSFTKPEYRILVLLLFDSGFRIQEMLSAKKGDLTFEVFDNEGDKCFWIKCNESKTEIRNIPVPLFTEDIKNFCNSTYFETLTEAELLFPVSYAYFTRQLKHNSKELFKVKQKNKDNKIVFKYKIITCHALRHSSATYYAKEYDGNMNLISQRYGWSFSSKELKTYIRASGAYQKAGAKKSYSNEVTELKKKNIELEEKMQKIAKMLTGLKQKQESVPAIMDRIMKKSQPKIEKSIDKFRKSFEDLKKGDKLIIKGKTYTLT